MWRHENGYCRLQFSCRLCVLCKFGVEGTVRAVLSRWMSMSVLRHDDSRYPARALPFNPNNGTHGHSHEGYWQADQRTLQTSRETSCDQA